MRHCFAIVLPSEIHRLLLSSLHIFFCICVNWLFSLLNLRWFFFFLANCSYRFECSFILLISIQLTFCVSLVVFTSTHFGFWLHTHTHISLLSHLTVCVLMCVCVFVFALYLFLAHYSFVQYRHNISNIVERWHSNWKYTRTYERKRELKREKQERWILRARKSTKTGFFFHIFLPILPVYSIDLCTWVHLVQSKRALYSPTK